MLYMAVTRLYHALPGFKGFSGSSRLYRLCRLYMTQLALAGFSMLQHAVCRML